MPRAVRLGICGVALIGAAVLGIRALGSTMLNCR
jgi:hypothetical protein